MRRWLGGLLQVVLALALLEGLLRVAVSLEPIRSRLHRFGEPGKRVSLLEQAIALHGGTSPDGVIWGRPMAHDPQLGWRLVPGEHVQRGRPVTISEERVRSKRLFGEHAPEGTRRLLVFGDSFTFGDEVGDDDVFVPELDAALAGIEAVDLGVLGYGHDQILLRLEEEGARWHPDAILFVFTSCDIERNVLDLSTYAKPRFELEDGALRLVGVPVPSPEELVARYRRSSRLLDVLGMWQDVGVRWLGIGESGQAQSADALTLAILQRFHAEAATTGAKVAFVFAPIPTEYETPGALEGPGALTLFRTLCQRTGATCWEAGEAFIAAHAAGEDLTEGHHWSPAGHRLLADFLAPRVADWLGEVPEAPEVPPEPLPR